MTEKLNGQVPAAVAPDRPDGRKYCDTCKYSQMILAQGGAQMICREQGPQVAAGVFIANIGGQNMPQMLTQTVWCTVNREDWCPKHVLANEARPRLQPANETSVIAQQ